MAFSALSSNLLLIKELVRNLLTSPKPRDGLGDMKHSESETFNDGLAGWGVWWAGPPGRLQQAMYPLTRRCSPPRFLIGWVLWGVQSSRRSPVSLFPFFSLPNLHPQFSRRTYLLVYPFSQHPVCLGPSRCLSCVSSASFRQIWSQGTGSGWSPVSFESPSPNRKFKESRPQLYLKNPGFNFVLKMDHFKQVCFLRVFFLCVGMYFFFVLRLIFSKHPELIYGCSVFWVLWE